jgi:hypothetical protein
VTVLLPSPTNIIEGAETDVCSLMDICLFTYAHMSVHLCTSLFTYDTFGVGCTDGGKLLHPAELCRISPPGEVVDLNGMNVSRSIGVIIAPIIVTDAV